jgi:hypothetical protein
MGNSSKTHHFMGADIRHVKDIPFGNPAISLIKWNRMQAGIAPKRCGFRFCLAADFLKDGAADTSSLVMCAHCHPAKLQGAIRDLSQRRTADGVIGIIGCQYMHASGGIIDIELCRAPRAVRAEDMPADIDEALQHLVVGDDGYACGIWGVV